jgi:hypothetical protein
LFEYQSATAGEAEDTSFAAAPRCSRQASDEHETLRQGTLFLVAVSLVIAVGMLLTERVATDAASLSAAAQGTAALLLSSVILRPRAKLERLADFFGVQGLVALSGFAGGVISLMGLRMHFDLQDEALLAIDRAIGFDAESYIGSVIRAPDLLFQLSGGAYTSTLGILLVSLFIASLIGEQLEVGIGSGEGCGSVALARVDGPPAQRRRPLFLAEFRQVLRRRSGRPLPQVDRRRCFLPILPHHHGPDSRDPVAEALGNSAAGRGIFCLHGRRHGSARGTLCCRSDRRAGGLGALARDLDSRRKERADALRTIVT